MNAVTCGEMARHKGGSRGRTDRAIDIELCEQYAVSGEPIQIGCSDLLVSVAAQVTPAQVISKNKDKIGSACLCRVFSSKEPRGQSPSGYGRAQSGQESAPVHERDFRPHLASCLSQLVISQGKSIVKDFGRQQAFYCFCLRLSKNSRK
jgi:hypothetical protein